MTFLLRLPGTESTSSLKNMILQRLGKNNSHLVEILLKYFLFLSFFVPFFSPLLIPYIC